ncbi:MAG TPA: glycoside hydrolase family 2 TIM barrel-domain containing protein [Terriglobia bacterium]|nr:glycoside hydrolase family 2 TIM barrel-domain containing protein [Terriglobia bacterium]
MQMIWDVSRRKFLALLGATGLFRAGEPVVAAIGMPAPASAPNARQTWTGDSKPRPTKEILLSGDDWKLGSFPMGIGEKRKAFETAFNEDAFRVVPVPAEVQLTMGLEGMDLYRQTKKLALINKSEWWYRKRFTVPADAAGQRVRLVFEGADYFASAWLNGEKLGDHEGVYMSFSYDITSRVKPGDENLLAVKVTCPWLPKDMGLAEYMKGSFCLVWPGTNSTNFPELPHELSFCWNQIPAGGNAILTLGLVRDVKLVISPPQSLEDVFVRTKSLNSDGSATLKISGKILNNETSEVRRTLEMELRPANFTGNVQQLPQQTLNLAAGANEFNVETIVKDAKLWWSWDLGSPNLYKLFANLSAAPGRTEDRHETIFGIRTVARKTDQSYWLNGKHLLVKGAWYPMGHYYLSQNTRTTYETDLRLLRAANANFIVNHTVVEKPSFYELCDELGIMVFIQMPFNQPGPLYAIDPESPRREPFLKMFFEQGSKEVRELRNHPSIVIWSPFAESRWTRWSKYYGPLYDGMERVVEQLDPGVIYQPSYCNFAEEHLWSAAEAGVTESGSYQDFFDFQPAFVSEYGCDAMPSYENLAKMLSPRELWSDQNPRRAAWYYLPIDVNAYGYIGPLGTVPSFHSMLFWPQKMVDSDWRSAQEMVEASQLYQAFIMRYATDAMRRKKYNPIQGIRWWEYKDHAPGLYGGFLDFDQVPTMAYYAFKRSMAPLAVSLAIKDELEPQVAGRALHIPVWVVNDHRFEIPLDVHCEVCELTGRRIYFRSIQATVGPDESRTVGVMNWTVPEVKGAQVFALRVTARQQGGNLAANTTIYLKAVPKPSVPILDGVPKLDRQCRLLLIGIKRFAKPIAVHLQGLGVDTDEINEDRLDRFAELRQPETLLQKYDVVWLASFEALWKVLDDDMAEGLAQAVRQGASFIHTGGNRSFHGGDGVGACLDFTKVAEVLPVEVRQGRDDLNLLNSSKDVRVFARGWTDAGLKETGVPDFNEVQPKEGSQTIMKFRDWPLLVAGQYGKGRTLAFMGFAPTRPEPEPVWFALYGQMLMEALGQNPEYRYAALAPSNKPLMQLLKEQPCARVNVSPAKIEATFNGNMGAFAVEIANGERFARLVRLRMDWQDPRHQPHVVMYDDNYFDLFPVEKKNVLVDFRMPATFTGTLQGTLIIEGTNLPLMRVPVRLRAG